MRAGTTQSIDVMRRRKVFAACLVGQQVHDNAPSQESISK